MVFSLDDFMVFEFKSWLYIYKHEYLKLVNVTLFEKVIDRNLIYDHDLFWLPKRTQFRYAVD